ncbi:MAG: response regulator [Candidatus Gastranaerophilales bacterium]|nr:response regulator [Candidatus Gastranaerophilales bacterium]
MNGSFVLIFDKRVEISNKYKKILEHDKCASVNIVVDEENFFEQLKLNEPELVLISESVTDNLSELCLKIRNHNLEFRPIIILLSKSNYSEDKTNALNAGADDFLSEPMEQNEFLARIKAHIRRTLEENSLPVTNLPDIKFSKKILKRTMKSKTEWATLLIGFDNFTSYREIYGEIAYNKILQAFSAILRATAEYDDFIGQFENDNFLIITSTYKCEKLADYLNYAFDSISKKFYSDEDAQRGYILLHGNNKAGCKIPLITTSIGIVNSDLITYKSELEVINALNKVQKLAKTILGSSKIIDRPLITSDEIMKFINEKNIVVIEEDEDLSYLLETTLKIQGFVPTIYKNYEVTVDDILSSSPSLIIIDSGKNETKKGLELCKKIRENSTQNIKIIFTDTAHEKEEILNSGADLYFPKPYDLMELFQWIYKLSD